MRCLLRGLRGEAFFNDGCGRLSLRDLGDYTRSEMAFFADGHPVFIDASAGVF